MKAADPNEGHDPLCPVEPCLCVLIHRARVDERQRIALGIWAAIEPVATWVAGVNAGKLT